VTLNEPWLSFLHAVDKELSGPTEIHCFGGFVVAEYYGVSRPTADIDVIEARGAADRSTINEIAGRGSPLAKQHRVYVDIVNVAAVPENYEARLIAIFPDEFKNLRLKAFERHDLALAKLGRNQDHDREDVKRLEASCAFSSAILNARTCRLNCGAR
jgi:hypothetical protein